LHKMNHHYTRKDLLTAIEAVGIGPGDTVSLQVSLGRLGLPEAVDRNYTALSDFVIDAFLEVLGKGGTLVVPTYTYSIGRGQVYEIETTPSSIGDFPEVFRGRPNVLRSRDPMLSSAAVGPNAAAVLRNISQSCYGSHSTFQRLRELDAKICTLGLSLYWATFRHHIEEMAGVPFRFPKMFTGIVREAGKDSRETWAYFAAPFVENCQPNGLPLERLARAAGLVGVAGVGRGEIMAIDATAYFQFGIKELQHNPWLTAKGPPERGEVIFKDEPQWWAAGPAASGL
jgi:aminoglycoside 3-N-acetyltransferase